MVVQKQDSFKDLGVNFSAVTILKSKSKIAIFCQNRPKSKSLSLLSYYDFFAAINGCFTGLNDVTIFIVIVVLTHGHVGVSCRPTAFTAQ